MRLGQEKKGKPGRKIQKACGKGLSGHLLQSGWLSPLWAFFFKRGLVIAFPLSGWAHFPFPFLTFWVARSLKMVNCRMSFQMTWLSRVDIFQRSLSSVSKSHTNPYNFQVRFESPFSGSRKNKRWEGWCGACPLSYFYTLINQRGKWVWTLQCCASESCIRATQTAICSFREGRINISFEIPICMVVTWM